MSQEANRVPDIERGDDTGVLPVESNFTKLTRV